MTITKTHLLVQAKLPPLQGAACAWTKKSRMYIITQKNRFQAIYTVLAHLCNPSLARLVRCHLHRRRAAQSTDLFHELGHIVDGVVDHDPQ